jgi:hypothetical protein
MTGQRLPETPTEPRDWRADVLNSRRLGALGASVAALAAVAIAASSALGGGSPPIPTAFDDASGQVQNAADNNDLADAVTGWDREHPKTGPGRPLLAQSKDLLVGVGTRQDTLTAFPTSKGAVCYQILAAGTCGRLDTPTGITFSILAIRDRGTRLFGVAADDVVRVQVVVDGVAKDAVLRKNGFHYQLVDGSDGSDVQRVISTLADGTIHTVNVHG